MKTGCLVLIEKRTDLLAAAIVDCHYGVTWDWEFIPNDRSSRERIGGVLAHSEKLWDRPAELRDCDADVKGDG